MRGPKETGSKPKLNMNSSSSGAQSLRSDCERRFAAEFYGTERLGAGKRCHEAPLGQCNRGQFLDGYGRVNNRRVRGSALLRGLIGYAAPPRELLLEPRTIERHNAAATIYEDYLRDAYLRNLTNGAFEGVTFEHPQK